MLFKVITVAWTSEAERWPLWASGSMAESGCPRAAPTLRAPLRARLLVPKDCPCPGGKPATGPMAQGGRGDIPAGPVSALLSPGV